MSPLRLRTAGHGAAVLWLALLGGCFSGGGGDDVIVAEPPPAATEIPDSALVSADAYTRFALGLSLSDSAAPLNVDKVVDPPTSDTAEPLPLP